MKHYGDITQIHGDAVETVDIITGGSPCQDLSVAGKRAGLDGERSGLFMEQVRIVKEMREHDVRTHGRTGQYVRPRYMVWENVPGAFSSNGGKDFQAVLTEIARVVEPKCPDVPMPEKNKWGKAGCIYDDLGQWSIAWRVHDAQFWGVPQRRKRIALVADFGGMSAPEILFERKGLSWDPGPCGTQGEGTAENAERSVNAAIVSNLNNPSVLCLNDQGGQQMAVSEDMTGALRAEEHGHQPLVFEPGIASRCGGHIYADIAGAIRANAGDNQQTVAIGFNRERCGAVCADEIMPTVQAAAGESGNNKPMVVYGISSYDSNAMKSPNPNSGVYEADTARTLDLNGGSPACNQGGMAVVQAAGFDGNMGAKAGNIAFQEEQSPTLNAGKQMTVVIEGNGSRPSHQGDGFAEGEVMYTLNATERHAIALENHPADSRVKVCEDGVFQTLSSRMGTGGGNVPMVMESVAQNWDGADVAPTLTANNAGGGQRMPDKDNFNAVVQTLYTFRCCTADDVCMTIQARDYKDPQCVGMQSIVRRLTPTECERLQGFPDGWTDIGDWVDSRQKKHKGDSDAPRYKALGNSIALPFWAWLARRICAQYERPMTMASLFDGIGGFPLVFSRAGCTPVWASEIEEFPIAVTKRRFPE